MEKRLGQRKGDMPRYFDWKLNPRRMRSSLKCTWRSSSRDFQGDRERQELHHLRLGEVAPAFERTLQERQELFQLVAIVGDEVVKARCVFRADRCDGLFHALDIWGGEQLAAGAEDEPVLRDPGGVIGTSWSRSYPAAAKISRSTCGYRKKVGPMSKLESRPAPWWRCARRPRRASQQPLPELRISQAEWPLQGRRVLRLR